MTRIWAALALVLALLSIRQVSVWTSDEALWQSAARWAPDAPRPLINLAVERLARGDDVGAAFYLRQAEPLIARQPPFEQAWSRDVLEVNWAVIDIRAGRLDSARQRLQNAPPYSLRARLCQRMPTVCE